MIHEVVAWMPERNLFVHIHIQKYRPPFRLHWTSDEWNTVKDTPSVETALGIDFVDVPIPADQRAPVRVTFLWTNSGSWEGRDYMVEVEL